MVDEIEVSENKEALIVLAGTVAGATLFGSNNKSVDIFLAPGTLSPRKQCLILSRTVQFCFGVDSK